jgi:hypothetical protein
MHVGYWWKSQKERVHWEDPRHMSVDDIKMVLREIGCMVWIGLMWLTIGTSGGIL